MEVRAFRAARRALAIGVAMICLLPGVAPADQDVPRESLPAFSAVVGSGTIPIAALKAGASLVLRAETLEPDRARLRQLTRRLLASLD